MKIVILCFALFAFIECRGIDVYSKSHKIKKADTVEVGLYHEYLCPACRQMIMQQVFPTFNKLFNATPSIMTLNLVPFGNAQMSFNKNTTKHPSVTFTCQHGQAECDGNILQSCAVVKYDIQKSFPFIDCMHDGSHWQEPWTAAAECAKKLNLDYNMLSECASTEEGVAIEYFMAGQTNALEPAHTYTPWITINGVHTEDIQQKATLNLLKLVCDTYQGSPKPKECDSA